jgi:hypothetical protein
VRYALAISEVTTGSTQNFCPTSVAGYFNTNPVARERAG